MTGGVVSPTNTANVHAAELPDVSMAIQTTLVKPKENKLPLEGVHATDCTATLSVAVGSGKVIAARACPTGGDVLMLAPHVMTGGMTSVTDTENEHEDESCALSNAIQVTVVDVDELNWLPVGGLQDTFFMPLASVAVAVNETVAY